MFPAFTHARRVPVLLGWIASAFVASAADPGLVSAPLAPRGSNVTRLALLPPSRTGITFSNHLSAAATATNRLLEIGSGVALGDVDGDGRPDIYLCGIDSPNRLYRNLGNWQFEDIAQPAGVECPANRSTGTALVDLDGDGDLDLLVNGLGTGTRLFRNDGRARFVEDRASGLLRNTAATSLALADFEGDGDLDLYVTHYRADTFLDHPPGLNVVLRTQADGSPILEPRQRFLTLPGREGVPVTLERGEADVFYLNRGGGRFDPVPWTEGLFRLASGTPLPTAPTDWGLAVVFRDLDGDRRPDLYVANDFVGWPDRIWLNRDNEHFQAASPFAWRVSSLASMAVDVADVNRDGHDDVFVADMLSPRREARAWQRPDTLHDAVDWPRTLPAFIPEAPRNTLHLCRGDGTYAEIAAFAGVAATDWTPSAAFLDVDLDGWEDLLIVAGNLHDVQDADALEVAGHAGRRTTPAERLAERARLPDRFRPAMAWRNGGDLRFEESGRAWRFDAVGAAHGFAFADLDGDGDQDVVVNAMNEPARVYRNDAPAPRLIVRLRGSRENSGGIGARVIVRGGPVEQSQEIMAGGALPPATIRPAPSRPDAPPNSPSKSSGATASVPSTSASRPTAPIRSTKPPPRTSPAPAQRRSRLSSRTSLRCSDIVTTCPMPTISPDNRCCLAA